MEEIDRSNIINNYIQDIRNSKTTCSDCNRVFYGKLRGRMIKYKPEGTTTCNDCWKKTQKELSDKIWKKVYEYKPYKCEICLTEKNIICSNENAFDPTTPRIHDLVEKQADWNIIQEQLDKCSVFCFECENIVNIMLMPQLKYYDVRYNIDKQLVNETINTEEYNKLNEFYRTDYEIKKKQIIEGLSQILREEPI